jgi:hypothetical protein
MSYQLRVSVDPDLFRYDEVWTPAGRWTDVDPSTPKDLVRAGWGELTDLE